MPGSRPTPAASRSPPRTPKASSRQRARKQAGLVIVGPEAPLVEGAGRRTRGGRDPGLRPQRRGRPAGGLEALRQGADGRGGGADRLPRGDSLPSGGGREDRERLVSRRAQGRRAGRGQGRDHLRQRARCPRRGGRLLRASAASAAPRWCWRNSWTARSCHCWRCATARTWCRWRPPRTTSGSATATKDPTPAAWAATRRCRASGRTRWRHWSTRSTGPSSRRWPGAGHRFTACSTPG